MDTAIEYLTVRELAERLGIHRRSVHLAVRAGELAGSYKDQDPRGELWRIPATYATREAWEQAVGRPGRPRLAAADGGAS